MHEFYKHLHEAILSLECGNKSNNAIYQVVKGHSSRMVSYSLPKLKLFLCVLLVIIVFEFLFDEVNSFCVTYLLLSGIYTCAILPGRISGVTPK